MSDASSVPDARSGILEAVVRRDRPPCPACRRRLSELRGGACPACGTSLALSLDRRGAGSAEWAAGVLAAGIGFGFYAVTAPALVGHLVGPAGPGGPPLARAALIAWGAGLLVTGTLLAGWLAGRARIRRHSRAVILAGAAATLATSVASIVVLAAFD